jgi:hypothetical protein
MQAWKIIKIEHVRIKLNLYRMIYNDSGAQVFTVNTTHDNPSTMILPELN